MTEAGFGSLVESLLRMDAASAEVGPPRLVRPLDLTPRSLVITGEELDFTKRLGRLMPTPRSAKRLTNIYRLIRASVREEELPEFISVGHQPLLLLLAAFIGYTEQ